MPRDGSGIYHRPVGTDAVTDTTIESTKYNVNVADVEQDLNQPRPIISGGTGATSADGVLDSISAEKFKQVVTNWDATVWRAGSYYAATTATGAAPVAGHAFAGITYYANATDFVCEARDLTDPTSPAHYIRVMTAGVWGAWVSTGSSTSGNVGEYIFDSGITFPPAAGKICFNNATQNSTTEVFISHITALGIDNTGLIGFTLRSGYDFYVQDKDEPAKWKMFTATADPVLSGGDFRVTVVFKSAGTDLVSGQRMIIGANSGSAVRYDTVQSLTAAQQVQARQNIYAAPFDALSYNGMQINGSMDISQENGSVGQPGAINISKYIVDGWFLQTAGVQVLTIGQTANFPPGYSFCAATSVTTVNGAPAATDYCTLGTKIEGFRVARLAWGTSSAQPVTIGFWIYAVRPGTYSGAVSNGAFNRSYPFNFTINTTVTWEYKTVTIPGDTTGTWTKDNSTGMVIYFSMMAGTSRVSPAGAWAGVGALGATGTFNGVSSGIDQMAITGVVVLPGIDLPSIARTPLIMRPADQELNICRRYWESMVVRAGGSGTYAGLALNWLISKRATPTFTFTDNVGNASRMTVGAANNVTISAGSVTASSVYILVDTVPATSPSGTYWVITGTGNARL